MVRDFDDNDFPLAYLITFRSYGSWVHGDERSSTDRRHNVYGTPKIPPHPGLFKSDQAQLQRKGVNLGLRERRIVARVVKMVCEHRRYLLRGLNVRTNHVHCVVSAFEKPEMILNSFKAYATRALREARLVGDKEKVWSRHGSTIYLWKERDVEKAMEYVMLGQGDYLI